MGAHACLGSAVGSLLGAAAFFAVEGWIPITGDAEAWEQKPPPLTVTEGDSPNAAEDGLRAACLSGSFFELETGSKSPSPFNGKKDSPIK